MCIVIYKCVKYILKIKEVMLIFFVIDFVFFLNFEVFLCLLYYNGWIYIICKKDNLNIDYEYEKSFKNLILVMLI